MANGNRPTSNTGSTTLLTVVMVVVVIYFARVVFIPLTLAMLLAFLLAPVVMRLRRWGLGRVPATAIVVLCSFTLLGSIAFLMASQLSDLAHKLPEYQQNIHKKLQSLRNSGGGFVNRLSRAAHNISEELTPPQPSAPSNRPNEPKAVPVEIQHNTFSPLEAIQKVVGSVLNVALTAGIVVVFVIFMLIQWEDLRDRVIRLAGERQAYLTTQVLDEAAQRISRYLSAQLVVNVAFGALTGLGLLLMHIPNPLLWGLLAAIFRYIPYLGIWIALVMPAAVAFAVEPEWIKVPGIIGLYFGVDLLMYNVAEPLLYGRSTGVTPIAILVAAVFWTWLWGPVGLLLATPLTVCVVVLGRYVPNLDFLAIMFSDEEILTPSARFYQRMLAMDLEAATGIVEEFLKGRSLEQLFDEVLIPALSLAEEERHRGKLDAERRHFILRHTRMLVQDIAERAEDLVAGRPPAKERATPASEVSRSRSKPLAEASVLCIPARDEADAIAAQMLVQLLGKKGIAAKELRFGALSGHRDNARVACVSAVPPLGYMRARRLCCDLHRRFRNLKLVAAILTERDVEEIKQRQPAIPADDLASSLKQALQEVLSILPRGSAGASNTA